MKTSIRSLFTPLAAAIALGSFLLFQVQPLIAKTVLPWYGGSAAVWTACLLFFQGILFLGYLYAHLLCTWAGPRAQGVVHAVVVLAALLFLPLSPALAWKPQDTSVPTLRILGFLGATLAGPYFALSASSPLLQRWYAFRSGRTPYPLFALSNLGSLVGLLSYPFLVEPTLRLRVQEHAWSALYLLYAVLVCAVARGLRNSTPEEEAAAVEPLEFSRGGLVNRVLLPLALSFTGALCLAATTHYLSQNVAVVPLLWVLPLALYLVSFILVFGHEGFYRRGVFAVLLVVSTAAVIPSLFSRFGLPLAARIFLIAVQLFIGCTVLHGELAHLRPPWGRLTGYYLLISAGGVLGTSFVAFVAPVVFLGYREYQIGLVATCALALVTLLRAGETAGAPRKSILAWGAAGALALVALVVALRFSVLRELQGTVRAGRNFYGVCQVISRNGMLEFWNGGVMHGLQFLRKDLRQTPTTYYAPTSGLAVSLWSARKDSRAAGGDGALRIGCVGLGVGVIAAYAIPGDTVRFFELNPTIESIARKTFTFLGAARGGTEVVLGDARLSLEREQALAAPRYDVLVLDAFTGDAIPTHLLTRECFALYLSRLAPGGRILLHITNNFLDLRPLAFGLAQDAGIAVQVIENPDGQNATFYSRWVVMARDEAQFTAEEKTAAGRSINVPARRVVWSDDYSGLLRLLM